MKKESFIKSTLILIIGGFFTKILGMFIKIITTRYIGLEGMSIYMLILPTFSLFLALSQLSLPTSISKLVGEEKYNNKNLIFSSIPIIIITDIILISIILLTGNFIANNLLKDSRCYLPIIAICLVLPFEAISNMLRGYFFGKQKMLPHVISHILEQIIRLTLTIILIPILLKKNIIYSVTFLVLVNMISEGISIFILLCFMPKDIIITKEDIKPDLKNIKNILDISIPNTSTRLIGNIGYFLEPILLTSGMILAGYSKSYISLEYGIITGYAMPILLLPGFFTLAISSSLIPVISKAYVNKNYKYTIKKINQGIFLSLIVGIPITILLFVFPDIFLKLIYGSNIGANYLKVLSIPFLFYYIEIPLSACLQAMNKSKEVMLDNLIGIIIKCILIYLLSLLNINIYSFIIACSFNIFIVTILHIIHIKNLIKLYINSTR